MRQSMIKINMSLEEIRQVHHHQRETSVIWTLNQTAVKIPNNRDAKSCSDHEKRELDELIKSALEERNSGLAHFCLLLA